MRADVSPGHALAADIVNRIEKLLADADGQTKPLEVNPFRPQLFELFVMADATGFVAEGSNPDLTCDGIARELAQRWNLADATRESVTRQSKLPPEHLSKMRMLWSFMRMWMEWTYAWRRWNEFHQATPGLPHDEPA